MFACIYHCNSFFHQQIVILLLEETMIYFLAIINTNSIYKRLLLLISLFSWLLRLIQFLKQGLMIPVTRDWSTILKKGVYTRKQNTYQQVDWCKNIGRRFYFQKSSESRSKMGYAHFTHSSPMYPQLFTLLLVTLSVI